MPESPVAVGDGHARGLDVALAPDEVPQEVAPVHVIELVGEKVVEVFEERRFDDHLRFIAVVVGDAASEIEHFVPHGAAGGIAHDLAVVVPQQLRLGAVGGPGLILFFALAVVPHTGEQVHEPGRGAYTPRGS